MTPRTRVRVAALLGVAAFVTGAGGVTAKGASADSGGTVSAGTTSATGAVDLDAPDVGLSATVSGLTAAGPDGAAAPAGSVSVIVRGTSAAAAAAAVAAVGGTVTGTLASINSVTANVAQAALPALSLSTAVSEVSADAALTLTPADGATTDGTDATVTPAVAAQQIGANAAYAAGLTGAGVDVAVLDTGIVPIAGLNGPGKLLLGPDLSIESQSPMSDLDGFGHGTAMASILGASKLPDGFQGVAPGVRILPVKVGASDGSVDVSQVIAGIDWVVAHAHDTGVNVRVLNISFGSETAQPAALDPLVYAAENAWRHGIVVVTSVGNDGRTDHRVSSPALDNTVLSVGAADTTNANPALTSVAPFSSLGNSTRHADVLAPGVHILGLRDPGSTLDLAYPAARRGTAYFRGSGTSHAAAVASGAVALLLQQRPLLTPDQVKQLLVGTADPLATAPASTQGAGLIDLAKALVTKTPPVTPTSTAVATGLGSLELARGGVHLVRNGVLVTGEQTVLGTTWDPVAWTASEAAGTTWATGTWLGITWPGATWQGTGWQGASWAGASWAGASWAGASWAGASWAGNGWQGASWAGSGWQGASWAGASWAGASWQGASWAGSGWAGATWTRPPVL